MNPPALVQPNAPPPSSVVAICQQIYVAFLSKYQ
jgi:hypothetical protein